MTINDSCAVLHENGHTWLRPGRFPGAIASTTKITMSFCGGFDGITCSRLIQDGSSRTHQHLTTIHQIIDMLRGFSE